MKFNNLIVINKAELENFIKSSKFGMETNEMNEEEYASYQGINYLANRLLKISKPLLPFIEDAFDSGSERGEHGHGNANDKQEYLNKEIEF